MIQSINKNRFNDVISDDNQATDTSMFNAADIVNHIEKRVALDSKKSVIQTRSEAKRRFEALREERRLQAELQDLNDYNLED